MANVRVEFLDDAAFESIQALPDPHCDLAWDLLEHLQTAPYFGRPLGNRIKSGGDLSDSRTLYVIDFEEKRVEWPPPYRIVYRLLPSEAQPQAAQIIWAGERDDDLVYRIAGRRLGRAP